MDSYSIQEERKEEKDIIIEGKVDVEPKIFKEEEETEGLITTPEKTEKPQRYEDYFVKGCTCEIGRKIENFDLIVKEATTGYFDPNTQQTLGNFVTYVIEFEVKIYKFDY